MIRNIETRYWPGDVVYLRVNGECVPGMITRLAIVPNGAHSYAVTWRGANETWHYECELTSEYVPDYGACEQHGDEAAT